MKTTLSTIALAVSLTIGFHAAPVNAHEDLRLKAALVNSPGTVGQYYQKAQLYAQLGNLWKELDDKALGAELFERSQQASASVEDPYVQAVLAGHLANEIASTGDFARAQQVLDTVTDEEVWVKTAWKLVGKMAKAKQTAAATELLKRTETIAQRIEDHELRAELLSGTGAAYRHIDPRRGENLVYEAFGIAQMLPDAYDRAIMLNEAGAHLMDIGHRELAIEVFDRVDRLVEQIDDPLKQAKALAMLGGEQAEKNLRERAALALERARRIAQGLDEGEDKFEVMSEIARNFGQSHRFETGIVTADEIADPYHRAEGYIRIAKNMYRAGDKKLALELLARTEAMSADIQDPYRRAVVLRKLASEQITAGAREHARSLLQQALNAIAARG